MNSFKKNLISIFTLAMFFTTLSFARGNDSTRCMQKDMLMKNHKIMMCDSTAQNKCKMMNCADTTKCAMMKCTDSESCTNMKECRHNKMMMSDSTSQGKCTMMKCRMDKKKMNHSMMMKNSKSSEMQKESVVREGVIDLAVIDKNNDGKVFQDMMDYNVISDKTGKCPLCGMELKEVSLKEAKDALIKSGYKVK